MMGGKNMSRGKISSSSSNHTLNLISAEITDTDDNMKSYSQQVALLHKKVQQLERKLINGLESQNQFYQLIGKVQTLENKWIDWKHKYDQRLNQLQKVVSSLEERLGLSPDEVEKKNQRINDPESLDCYNDNDHDQVWNAGSESELDHSPVTSPKRSRSRTKVHEQDSSEENIINMQIESSDNEEYNNETDDYFSGKRKNLSNSPRTKSRHSRKGHKMFACKICMDINLNTAEELAEHYSTQHKIPETPKPKTSKPKVRPRPPTNLPCPDNCGKYFNTQSSVDSHLITCRGLPKPFKCEQCDVEFVHKRSMLAHVRNVHLKLNVTLCTECGLSFSQTRNLKLHIQRKHTKRDKNFTCTYCGRTFYVLNDLQKHTKIHTEGVNYPCTICGHRFRRQTSLKLHMYLHTGKPFSCKECGWKYTTKASLVRHEYAHKLGKIKVPANGAGKKVGTKRSGASKAQAIPPLSSVDSQVEEEIVMDDNKDFITPIEVTIG